MMKLTSDVPNITECILPQSCQIRPHKTKSIMFFVPIENYVGRSRFEIGTKAVTDEKRARKF